MRSHAPTIRTAGAYGMVCASSGLGCTGSSGTLCCGLVITVITGLPSANKFTPFGTEKRPDATASHGVSRVDRRAGETLTCARQENRMPATILDSAVFRDIFTTEAMRTVFSDENRVQKYLDFEAALARAQAK